MLGAIVDCFRMLCPIAKEENTVAQPPASVTASSNEPSRQSPSVSVAIDPTLSSEDERRKTEIEAAIDPADWVDISNAAEAAEGAVGDMQFNINPDHFKGE